MCQFAGLILCLFGAVLAAPSELLPNPGFEADAVEKSLPDGWTVLERRVGLTTKNVRSGKRALECHDAGANASVSVDSAHLPCNTSCCYTARAWLRPEGPARPSLYLQFFDDAGQRIGVAAKFAPASPDWISVSLGAVPPKAARTVSVLVFSGAAEEGTFQVDDLSLKCIPKEGPAVVDIGTQRQLFLDDYMVEEMESMERVFHSPRYAKEFWAYNNIQRDARDADPARRYKVLGMWARYGEKGNYAGLRSTACPS